MFEDVVLVVCLLALCAAAFFSGWWGARPFVWVWERITRIMGAIITP